MTALVTIPLIEAAETVLEIQENSHLYDSDEWDRALADLRDAVRAAKARRIQMRSFLDLLQTELEV